MSLERIRNSRPPPRLGLELELEGRATSDPRAGPAGTVQTIAAQGKLVGVCVSLGRGVLSERVRSRLDLLS